MKKIQFDILSLVYENKKISFEEICRKLFQTMDNIEKNYKELLKESYIDEKGLTKKGLEYIKSHKIENAVILAAGMSTRFVPLSYETPKALLKVKGEVLIERQIRQLKEKNIDDIVVVVGHMKEKFEYLREEYGVTLVETTDYKLRNNHSSVYAAKKYLKNTIITSSDLYFAKNIFQEFAYDSYYCTLFAEGKSAERGTMTDDDDKIIDTFYGDRCCDVWVTLGYAFFSKEFSEKMIQFIEKEWDYPNMEQKFWADIQDEHIEELYMYVKRVEDGVIYEFDSLEELREFDDKYKYRSDSDYMKRICYLLAAEEKEIINITSLHKTSPFMFKFSCKGDDYICNISDDIQEKIFYMGRSYYRCRDIMDSNVTIYRMDSNVGYSEDLYIDIDSQIADLYEYSKEFLEYHKRALPLCAAENVISEFANLPLSMGFQERYIMNNTYSFNMADNFIGCEKLFPFYQKISDVCERMFGAKYTDVRPFTGMNCIDMVLKTITKPDEKIMILDPEFGGHASVRPVAERLGLSVLYTPYDNSKMDLDYDETNKILKEQDVKYILLAPSDIVVIPDIRRLDISSTILLYDISQLMGLIAAGLMENPIKLLDNIIMFGGTHKTFPGPASGIILTNNQKLHELMEKAINPKFLRHSQMHQKISLLFALIEFEKYGRDYMRHMLHCSNYLGNRLKALGYNVVGNSGKISETHQIFIYCTKEQMDTIYDNAYKCEVTLNKKSKKLFDGYGIRLGTQEIARYDWNDEALDLVADILWQLSDKDIDIDKVKRMIKKLPDKKICYALERNMYECIEELAK